MTEGWVQVSSAEVIWTYLAHEYRMKQQPRQHVIIAGLFDLNADHFPDRWRDRANEIVREVETTVRIGQCLSNVLETIRKFQELQWEFGRISLETLGQIHSQLPGEFPPHGAYQPGRQGPIAELLPGWRDYLNLIEERPREDARAHEQILKELSEGGLSHRPILRDEVRRTVVGDGRHRLFAAYEYACTHDGFWLPVYWGRLRSHA